jgi:hypothetical protein
MTPHPIVAPEEGERDSPSRNAYIFLCAASSKCGARPELTKPRARGANELGRASRTASLEITLAADDSPGGLPRTRRARRVLAARLHGLLARTKSDPCPAAPKRLLQSDQAHDGRRRGARSHELVPTIPLAKALTGSPLAGVVLEHVEAGEMVDAGGCVYSRGSAPVTARSRNRRIRCAARTPGS